MCTDPFSATGTVYIPATGEVQVLKLKPHSSSFMVVELASGEVVKTRQRTTPKSQVGQARIPEGMSEAKAKWVATMVQVHFLKRDVSWEPYTSEILGQMLASAPDDLMM